MNMLWTKDEAVAATGGKSAVDWQVSGVSIDTRTLQKGDLFVALTDIRDGHDFVAHALEKGAAAALVSRVPDSVAADAPLLIVDDVLLGLEALGLAARARITGKVIGVTGSVGKTGTKEMLRCALTGQGHVHAAEKSYNNHWGVPLTLARMPRDTDFAVIEIGMNHAGEIGPLARMADLDVAVITIVAPVHLAAFSGINEIAQAKAEIFEGLKRGGTAVLNADIKTLPILRNGAEKAGAQIVTFGHSTQADFRLAGAYVSNTTTKVAFDLAGQKVNYSIAAPGVHQAMNSLAVLAACDAIGANLSVCIADLANWSTPLGRGTRETVQLADGQIELIDESYNANPTSMAAALSVLADAQPKGRKVAILGDMLEMGENEHILHAELAKLEAVNSVDVFHLVGPLMHMFHAALPSDKRGQWVASVDELSAQISELLEADDTVMVKGSLGSKVSKIVDVIRKISA